MITVLLMLLAVITSSVSSYRQQPSEQVMRDTLKHVMRCPEWPIDEDIQYPVAALSPARYMQLVAIVRKDSKENSCGRRSHLRFNLQDPDSWNFCAMGMCSEESCSCFKNFVGEKCNKFSGSCWLFYCHLLGCNREAPTLYCSCNPALYGTQIARRIYFYDHGFESRYIPPPVGFVTTAFVDSHLIRQTAPEKFEIIGGNYYRENKRTRASSMKYDEIIPILPSLSFKKPVEQYSEHYFDGNNRFNYNPNSRYIPKEIYGKYPARKSSRNSIVPDNSGQFEFRNDPYSESTVFYSAKSYKSNRETRNRANSKMRQPFFSVLEDESSMPGPMIHFTHTPMRNTFVRCAAGHLVPALKRDRHGYTKNFKSPSNRDISYSVPRRINRAQRTHKQTFQKSYLRNINRADLQYNADKSFNVWSENKHKSPYLLEKSNEIDPADRNDWYVRKNRPSRDFVNRNFESGLFDDDGLYRENQRKVLDENTIQETSKDNDSYEEAGDNEDFKFSLGSHIRCSFFNRSLYIIIINFILCFL